MTAATKGDIANQGTLTKVPEVTLGFWIIKVLATTLGETAGDAASMSMHLGYLVSTGLFAVVFAAFVVAQVRATRFHPMLYWATIVATTTVGTTLADFADRSLGIGYAGGSTLLLLCVVASLVVWYRRTGSISIETVNTPKVETFYWVTIMFSQTLGTALGDWTADTAGLGYTGSALLFGVARRLSRQARRGWRSRARPLLRVGDAARADRRRHPGFSPASRDPSALSRSPNAVRASVR